MIKVQNHSSTIAVWAQAVRPFSMTASITPVILGGVLAWREQSVGPGFVFPVFMLCAVLFHAATNLINDHYDFHKGVDRQGTLGSSGVLVSGLLTPDQVKKGAYVLFAAGFVLGLFLVAVRGVPILVLGVIGMLGGYTYTAQPFAYKYLALGDILVFVFMGVLLVVGPYYALTGVWSLTVAGVSLPVAALVTAILHANNLRDIRHDRAAGVKTLAIVLGHRGAQWMYLTLVGFAYLWVLVLAAAGILPPWSCLVLLSLPLAFSTCRMILSALPQEPASLALADVATAKLHFLFGLLLIISIIIGNIWS